MKKLPSIAAALVAASTGAASATDWYILRGDTKQCIAASTLVAKTGMTDFASPAALELMNREAGTFVSTTVKRDDNGKVIAAYVTSKETSIVYFAGAKTCGIARAASLRAGVITDPDELK